MAPKVSCEICGKRCKDQDGLDRHKQDKHPQGDTRKSDERKEKTKTVRNWIIVLAMLGLIVWALSGAFTSSSSCKTTPAEQLNIGSHQNLALHNHATLSILVNGIGQPIPTNIGVGPGLMRPVHTHDGTGKLHIEAPCRRDLTLGDFFKIWERPFSAQRLFDHGTDTGTLTLTVNGNPTTDFENYILRDGDNIRVSFTTT